VDSQTVKTKADEIALKVGIYLKCSNTWLLYFKERGHVMWQSVWREDNHQTFIWQGSGESMWSHLLPNVPQRMFSD